MRLRSVIRVCVLAVLVVPLGASIASAAPMQVPLTINAIPNPILAGEGTLIYGRLSGAHIAGQSIVLYRRVHGSGIGYRPVAETTTDPRGFYDFAEADVTGNLTWVVREAGADAVESRELVERVAALVDLSASRSAANTTQSIVFSGHVAPDHAGESVMLQELIRSTGDWKDLRSGRLDSGSNYSIPFRWRFARQERDVRVLFAGDNRDVASASDPVSVTIQQDQVPGFTIDSSSILIGYGQSTVISGVLDRPGTATPDPDIPVTLWAQSPPLSQPIPAADAMTGSDGNYSFPVAPAHDTIYEVRETSASSRHSAGLFEGVSDTVSLAASASTSTVGGTVTFTGTVLPDKAREAIQLQGLQTDGDWQTLEGGLVHSDSTFGFRWRFGSQGTFELRARITSDDTNISNESPPVSITVAPPRVSTLPPRP